METLNKKLDEIASGAYKMAQSPRIPISKDNYDPLKHGDKTYYRNSGNKHIPSRGL